MVFVFYRIQEALLTTEADHRESPDSCHPYVSESRSGDVRSSCTVSSNRENGG